MNVTRYYSGILLICVLSLGAAPLHAQWVKTDGPDSVQVLVTASSNQVYAGTKDGLFLSSDTGVTWTEISTGLTNRNVRAFTPAFGFLYAGTVGGGIFRSSDGGSNWEAVNNGLTNLDARSIASSQGQRTLLAATSGGVFLSADSGGSWTEINTGLPSLDVRDVLYRDSGAYAATDSGVFLRMPSDSVWLPLNNGLTTFDVRALAGDGTTSLVAGTGVGIFRWHINIANLNWSTVPGGPAGTVRALSLATGNPFMAYPQLAGTTEGVYFAYMDGESWKAINEGLPDGLDVRAVTVDHHVTWDSYMMAGAETGIWRRLQHEVIPASIRPGVRSSMASQLRLTGNHAVSFSLPARNAVSLTLHDLSGRTRATLLTGELAAGNHTARLDAASLPAGLYFVRLRTPEFSETRRVLLTE